MLFPGIPNSDYRLQDHVAIRLFVCYSGTDPDNIGICFIELLVVVPNGHLIYPDIRIREVDLYNSTTFTDKGELWKHNPHKNINLSDQYHLFVEFS